MSDHEMAEADRELRSKAVAAIQVASQLFSAWVQLRLLAQRRAEAAAHEDAQRARTAAGAVADQARVEYAEARREFGVLHDADWWERASPEEVKVACDTAMRWSGCSPEASAAARAAAEQIRERGLGDQVDVDVEALANARVDPAAAREFAAMQTGNARTSTRTAETDPNAAIVREAFGDRADEFLHQPMWDELSAQIDRAGADGRFDVVSLLQEGDRWRPYHEPDDPHQARRDRAGLLAWRVENYLDGSPEAPTLTWSEEAEWEPMRPRSYAETVIDGEVVDDPAEEAEATGSAEPPPAPNPDHEAMADHLQRTWPEGADRVTASRRWPDLAERLCRLRDDGIDVTAYLQDVNLNWSKVRDPAAYLSAVIDHDQPRPDPGRRPRPEAGAPDPRAARVELRHRDVAEALQDRWPDVADRLMTSRRWPDLANQFDRLADTRVDVPSFIRGIRFELGEMGAPESCLAAVLDRARRRKQERRAEEPAAGRSAAAATGTRSPRPKRTARPPRPEPRRSAAPVSPAVRSFAAAISSGPKRGPIPMPGRSGRGPIALPAEPHRGPHAPEKGAER